MNFDIYRGEIYLADLNPSIGSEQGGIRPVVILQNNIGNCFSTTTIVASITSHINDKPSLPTHVFIKSRDELRYDSTILLEQIRSIDKKRLIKKLGILNSDEMKDVDLKILISMGIKNNKMG